MFLYIKIFILTLPVVFLVGCIPVYQIPKNTPTAKLGVLHENFFTNKNIIKIYADPVKCLGIRRLPGGALVSIPANRLVTIFDVHFEWAWGLQYEVFTFYPKPNVTYYLSSKQYAGKDDQHEEVLYQILELRNGQYVPTLFVKRKLEDDLSRSPCVDNFNRAALLKRLKNSYVPSFELK